MLGGFWSELFGSVGSLIDSLTQRRGDGEFVFVDPSEIPNPDSIPAPESMQPPSPPMWVQAKAQLATLQQADPNFLEATFLTKATQSYSAALSAEGAMNADTLSGSATPAFVDALRERITNWHNGGFTRVVSGVKLDAPTTFKVTIGGATQSITVRFTGTMTRFTREDMTNLVTEGSAQPESFTEFATFVRPAGLTTPKNGDVSTHCPSCGAPWTPGAVTCAYCGATLSGTGGVWQLDHISVSAYT